MITVVLVAPPLPVPFTVAETNRRHQRYLRRSRGSGASLRWSVRKPSGLRRPRSSPWRAHSRPRLPQSSDASFPSSIRWINRIRAGCSSRVRDHPRGSVNHETRKGNGPSPIFRRVLVTFWCTGTYEKNGWCWPLQRKPRNSSSPHERPRSPGGQRGRAAEEGRPREPRVLGAVTIARTGRRRAQIL